MVYRDRGESQIAQEEVSLFQRLKDQRRSTNNPLFDEIGSLRFCQNDHLTSGVRLLEQGKAEESTSRFEAALEEDPSVTLERFDKAEDHLQGCR
jgi:hypothetical protein